jgi:hypothetical protein
MESESYTNIISAALTNLSYNFPTVFMITYLIPFYYLVSKLAEEKQSKSREGMKMMGLKDSSYYWSWLIFFLFINFIVSIIIALLTGVTLFNNSSIFLIFIMCFMYGLNLFG